MTSVAFVSTDVTQTYPSSIWTSLPSQGSSGSVSSGSYQVTLSGSGTVEYGGLVTSVPLLFGGVSGDLAYVAANISPGSASNSSDEVMAGIQLSGSSPAGDPTYTVPWVRISVHQGTTWCGWGTDSSGSTQYSTTYSSTQHQWLRLSCDGTDLSWDVSADGSTWTSLYSTAITSVPLDVEEMLYAQLVNYTWGSVASVASFSEFSYSPGLGNRVGVISTSNGA